MYHCTQTSTWCILPSAIAQCWQRHKTPCCASWCFHYLKNEEFITPKFPSHPSVVISFSISLAVCNALQRSFTWKSHWENWKSHWETCCKLGWQVTHTVFDREHDRYFHLCSVGESWTSIEHNWSASLSYCFCQLRFPISSLYLPALSAGSHTSNE